MSPSRILVVEDELIIRELMVEVLSEAGYDVDEAGGSETAVGLMDSDGYNLLVTDMNMPGKLNGLQIAQRAHEADGAMPVVFVTARHDMLTKLRNSGIPGAALPKPFDLDELVQTVHRLIGPAVRADA